MLSEKIEKALNEQFNAELYSGYLYLSMSAYLEEIGLPGFANLEKCNAEEELEHAMKFYDYIIRRGGRVTLEAIKKPQTEWENPVKVLEHVVSHEEDVTALINNIVKITFCHVS